MKGDDEVEGVEFLEVEAVSSIRAGIETSSFKYQSRLMMKSVMLNWYSEVQNHCNV